MFCNLGKLFFLYIEFDDLFLFLCFCYNTVWFYSKHLICHFYFLWLQIISVTFTPETVRCSNFLPCFYQFYFWLSVFHVLYCWQYFLTTHFKHFDFIEWFDLNSNFRILFERSSISDFFSWLFDVLLYPTKFFIFIKIWFIRINSNAVVTKLF